MPLTHLGQLKPTMKQQIALQKALLALSREDEAMRRKAEEKPALARRLAPTVAPRGPSYAEMHRPIDHAYRRRMEAAPVTRAPLERALAPGVPRPDWQARAWEKGREIEAGRQAELDEQADVLYEVVQDLSRKDQDFILSKVTEKTTPSALGAALGAEPGVVTPAAIRTDPLLQTLIDKHYVRLDEEGEYTWMLPMKEKRVTDVRTWTDEGRWLNQTTTYEDGTVETEIIGRAAKEEEAKGLTPSEELGWARLQFDVKKAGEIYVTQAMKARGPAPIEGITMIRRPGETNYRKARAEDVTAHWQGVKEDADYRRVAAEGIKSIDDVRITFQYNPEALKNFQRNAPGMTVDGKWSPALGQWIYDTFFKKEE